MYESDSGHYVGNRNILIITQPISFPGRAQKNVALSSNALDWSERQGRVHNRNKRGVLGRGDRAAFLSVGERRFAPRHAPLSWRAVHGAARIAQCAEDTGPAHV